MPDEQVVKLLEEIRDLQRLHLEKYQDAIKNQQEAIDIQKRAVRRQKITLLMYTLFLAALLGYLAWSAHHTG